MLLVKFSSDWADEFTVDGFTIMPKEDWEYILDILKTRFESLPTTPVEFSFGTNEGFEWHTLEEMMSCFSTEYIVNSEINVIGQFLNVNYNDEHYISYGIIPFSINKEEVLELLKSWD